MRAKARGGRHTRTRTRTLQERRRRRGEEEEESDVLRDAHGRACVCARVTWRRGMTRSVMFSASLADGLYLASMSRINTWPAHAHKHAQARTHAHRNDGQMMGLYGLSGRSVVVCASCLCVSVCKSAYPLSVCLSVCLSLQAPSVSVHLDRVCLSGHTDRQLSAASPSAHSVCAIASRPRAGGTHPTPCTR